MRVVDVMLAIPGHPARHRHRGVARSRLTADHVRRRRRQRPDLRAHPARQPAVVARVGLRDGGALASGASGSRLLFRHLLPNSLTPLIVAATLALATAIIDVAGLGFLGLGPPDPRTPEWGTMLTDSTKFLRQAPWLLFFPGAAIVISAIGFNLLGDGLRESLDPRMRR